MAVVQFIPLHIDHRRWSKRCLFTRGDQIKKKLTANTYKQLLLDKPQFLVLTILLDLGSPRQITLQIKVFIKITKVKKIPVVCLCFVLLRDVTTA